MCWEGPGLGGAWVAQVPAAGQRRWRGVHDLPRPGRGGRSACKWASTPCEVWAASGSSLGSAPRAARAPACLMLGHSLPPMAMRPRWRRNSSLASSNACQVAGGAGEHGKPARSVGSRLWRKAAAESRAQLPCSPRERKYSCKGQLARAAASPPADKMNPLSTGGWVWTGQVPAPTCPAAWETHHSQPEEHQALLLLALRHRLCWGHLPCCCGRRGRLVSGCHMLQGSLHLDKGHAHGEGLAPGVGRGGRDHAAAERVGSAGMGRRESR